MARTIVNAWLDSRKFDDCFHCNDFISIELLEKRLREKDLEEDSVIANIDKTKYGVPNTNKYQYSGKQACANHSYDILGARMLWKPKEARI